jgi:hypothetical protein
MLYRVINAATCDVPIRRDACQNGLHPDPPNSVVALFIHTFLVHRRGRYDRVSTGMSVEGRDMGFNSAPPPLSARLRPVREKW